MRTYFNLILSIFFIFSCTTENSNSKTIKNLHYLIKELSSDEMQGRNPGTEGAKITKNFIASEFKKNGLTPLDKTFFQEVPAVSSLVVDKSFFTISFRDQDKKFDYGSEVVFWSKRNKGEQIIRSSDLVFVGYGIVAPEYKWNDYAGVDVKGKTVVMLVNDPGFDTGKLRLFNGSAMTYYGRWTYKFEEAARQGAAAAIIIHEENAAAYPWSVVENSWTGPQLDLQRKNLGIDRCILESWISLESANNILEFTGFDYLTLKEFALDRNFQAFTLKGLKLTATIKSDINYFSSHNLIGFKKGTINPDEFIIFMAHWDHLGLTDEGKDKIYNGAVDNATGVAGIIELARLFKNIDTDRSLIFLATTLEESGLLGSEFFANYPPIDLANVVAGFNFDGILPTGKTKDMAVIGYGASELEELLERQLLKEGRYINPDPNPEKGFFYRSDHISFAKRGVPVLFSDDGFDLIDGGKIAGMEKLYDYTLNKYHAVNDEYDESWNLEGLEQNINTIFSISLQLANSNSWPNWYENNEFRAIRDLQLSKKSTP
jgi:Zn-dependent M28 family amino/carboxypeptidase|tara:strand:- start:5736 stop:7367 length:1632 start_codon:yes stop_codon:yes gene_type:complete